VNDPCSKRTLSAGWWSPTFEQKGVQDSLQSDGDGAVADLLRSSGSSSLFRCVLLVVHHASALLRILEAQLLLQLSLEVSQELDSLGLVEFRPSHLFHWRAMPYTMYSLRNPLYTTMEGGTPEKRGNSPSLGEGS
jgi:hypothetical protein